MLASIVVLYSETLLQDGLNPSVDYFDSLSRTAIKSHWGAKSVLASRFESKVPSPIISVAH